MWGLYTQHSTFCNGFLRGLSVRYLQSCGVGISSQMETVVAPYRRKDMKTNGLPFWFLEMIGRLSERTLDGVIIMDENFKIRLANPNIVNAFSNSRGGVLGQDYFKFFFGLTAMDKKCKKYPIYKAINNGESAKRPFPIIEAGNKITYQIETNVQTIKDDTGEHTIAMELWSRMGTASTFKKGGDLLEI